MSVIHNNMDSLILHQHHPARNVDKPDSLLDGSGIQPHLKGRHNGRCQVFHIEPSHQTALKGIPGTAVPKLKPASGRIRHTVSDHRVTGFVVTVKNPFFPLAGRQNLIQKTGFLIDDGRVTLAQERGLAVHILLEGRMLLSADMILVHIKEQPDGELLSVHAGQLHGLGGHLHNHMVTAVIQCFFKIGLKLRRLRRR